MIWLSRKEEMKRIILTLNSRNLEFIGVYNFITREKKIVKLYEAEVPQYCLFLSTETGNYGSTVTVSRKRYEKARIGQVYGLCGVIRNIKRDDFIIVVEHTDSETAIKQVVRKSRLKMVFIMVLLGLFLWTCQTFIYVFQHFSWN